MKTLRIINGILLAFIALNAIGGGYYALAGAESVPLEWLQGSPFKSYFIPGLFLLVIVGGACILASLAAFTNSRFARSLSFLCSGLLAAWIIIQVSIIGYVSWMQPAIFVTALIIAGIAFYLPRRLTNNG
jgi:hypothetical protein